MDVSTTILEREYRRFGLLISAIVVGVWGMWIPFRHHKSAPLWLWAVCAIVALVALGIPSILKTPYRLWMGLGHLLGRVNGTILLTVLFVTIFSPASLILRILRRDLLNRSIDPNATSYRILSKQRTVNDLKEVF